MIHQWMLCALSGDFFGLERLAFMTGASQ